MPQTSESLMPAGVKKYAQKQNLLDHIKPAPTLWLLFAVALALRLFFLQYRFAVAFDEVNYLKLGVSGHLNGWSDLLHTYWSPMLPACIKLFCNFFSDYELAARLVSVVAGALLIFPVYKIARTVFDEKVGVLAAGFLAIFPPIAFRDTLILTESLVMLFGAVAVMFGLRMLLRYSVGYALLAGLFAGLAYLAHPMAIAFFMLLAFWLVFGHLTRLFLINRLRLVYLAPALLVAFLLPASSYLLHLKQATGVWTLSAKAAANQQMATPVQGEGSSFRDLDVSTMSVPIDQVFHQGTFLQASNGYAKAGREVRPTQFAVKYIKNLADMLAHAIPGFFTTIPMLLFALGVLGSTWGVQQGKSLLYLISFPLFFWLLLVPAFHIHARYLTPVWPICAVFVANGMVHLHGWLSNYMPLTKLTWRKNITASTVAAAFIFGVFMLLAFLPEFGRVIARTPVSTDYVADAVEQKKAGAWLKQNTRQTPVIMSRNHAVDFYAGNYDITQSVTIPTSNLEQVLAYARHRGVTHLVLNERYARDYPELSFLLKEPSDFEHLRLIYQDEDDSGLMTVIYELAGHDQER